MAIERTFSSGADRYVTTASTSYLLRFLAGDDLLVTRAGSTIAYMGDGSDFVRVEAGEATVYGEDGRDRFDVYANGASANGGADDDLFNIRGGSGHVLYGLTGNDRFNFLVDSANVHLSGGDGDDLFVGYSNAISGRIYGGDGNDRFLGFGNHDGHSVVLRGGPGNDLYRLDAGSPATVDERVGEGIDTVQIASGVSYTLGANVENLAVLDGAEREEPPKLIGNGLANRITGGTDGESISGLAGNDRLDGGGGDDLIGGDEGNDRIFGGLGADTMAGGAGADIFAYRSAADAPYDEFWTVVDWIVQFDELDRIDLRAIDANSAMEGFQHFDVVQGSGSRAGTLYFEGDPAGWGWIFIEGHTDGDGVPDLAILITDDDGIGYPPVTEESFII